MKITIEISKEDYDFIKRIPKTYLLDDYLNVRLYAAIKDGELACELKPKVRQHSGK